MTVWADPNDRIWKLEVSLPGPIAAGHFPPVHCTICYAAEGGMTNVCRWCQIGLKKGVAVLPTRAVPLQDRGQ
jgi:hypothetical protein